MVLDYTGFWVKRVVVVLLFLKRGMSESKKLLANGKDDPQ
jgi:hypothetical protein